MELPSKLLEQIAFITRPKIEDYMFIVMDKSIHEEHLAQLLQTNNRHFKKAVTFLSGYIGIFNVTKSNNQFSFKKTITDEDGFIKITIPPGAYEIESLDSEIKRITFDEGQYTEKDYPFTIKPNFSILGSIIGISPQGPIISFMFDDNIKALLVFHAVTLNEEYNLSTNPVDILSIDNIFIQTGNPQGRIFRGKRPGIIFNWSMDVNSGFKYIHKFRGEVQWYIMESKDIISSIFKLKKEKNELLSYNGQSITFRLSIKEI